VLLLEQSRVNVKAYRYSEALLESARAGLACEAAPQEEPDFVLFHPDLGLVGFEGKDWEKNRDRLAAREGSTLAVLAGGAGPGEAAFLSAGSAPSGVAPAQPLGDAQFLHRSGRGRGHPVLPGKPPAQGLAHLGG